MKFSINEQVECSLVTNEKVLKVLGTVYSINNEKETVNVLLNIGSMHEFLMIDCSKINYIESYIKHFDRSNMENLYFKLNKGTTIVQCGVSYLLQEDIFVHSVESFKAMKV